ncbi:unnamed protein product [Mytilus edulis]|uniref:Uncharacterized protein n=1 Tax=Mytilus edulis TaxID=6550 RepID=A0A8S3USH0_MYTED|nr:unnamed protein product [Mytilus edulis]
MRRRNVIISRPVKSFNVSDYGPCPDCFEWMLKNTLEIGISSLRSGYATLDDEEELKSPSNAIKLKYDLVRMVNIKWAYLVKNSGSKEEKKTCKELLQLITVEWSEKVTKIARSVLTTRKLTHEREIPAPEDIRKINELKDYAIRRTDLNDVDESLIGDLTDLENELLRSQDLMVVRGKRSRPVPVIISNELKKPLEYLANPEIRKMFIKPSNKFLFPSTGDGPLRSYDSMKNVCEKLNLKRPESITSVTLRKYTATLSQVLSLKENEIGWLCKHLGHTKSVHTEHYKQLSGYVERVEIGKLMMIQDMNLVSKFKGKDLHSVNFTGNKITYLNIKQQDVYDINNDADDIDVDETVIHNGKTNKRKFEENYELNGQPKKKKKSRSTLGII